MDDAERERLHRFAGEAHALLRRDCIAYLRSALVHDANGAPYLIPMACDHALKAAVRALRLLEYALADTEPVPYLRREDDTLT